MYVPGDKIRVLYRNEEKTGVICSKWTNYIGKSEYYEVTLDGENMLLTIRQQDVLGYVGRNGCECGSETDRHSYFCPKDEK